ncbi:2,3-dihydro-2,3-dihydroxybenzoate dehydrogenase [Xenorhabdus sp. Vera]|uniref:2,3-dihydro-2,3-dihydroxybenzoate dehydrogenase n=1 Tax=Xenorhabdus koppenhoeferi TaxID=351659 RepID=UPI0019C05057|nr:2,3-dihydro-2,3-dihydroxybenzoate dehydrogenase [Xenorhabdus sp. Vera]MBD2810833.1 2,3-dihydro-2,3-dihydroxybenzoate dehydrogenase [Xenorhabdus sp. Vera]
MKNGYNFSGKYVWVTGAGKGIGYHTALAFHQSGAYVIGLDKAFPYNTYPYRIETINISDVQQVSQVCQHLICETKRLDVLVNAAGILHMDATEQLTIKNWQETFDVNVNGAFYLFQQTMPLLRQQCGGVIVTITSDAAYIPRIGMSAYSASKAALKSLAQTVGLELAQYGVRCNIVSPGSTNTDMQRAMWMVPDAEQQRIKGDAQKFKLGIPLGKIAQPQEIAMTILFLASEQASHITLQDITIDGGSSLGR